MKNLILGFFCMLAQFGCGPAAPTAPTLTALDQQINSAEGTTRGCAEAFAYMPGAPTAAQFSSTDKQVQCSQMEGYINQARADWQRVVGESAASVKIGPMLGAGSVFVQINVPQGINSSGRPYISTGGAIPCQFEANNPDTTALCVGGFFTVTGALTANIQLADPSSLYTEFIHWIAYKLHPTQPRNPACAGQGILINQKNATLMYQVSGEGVCGDPMLGGNQ